MDTALVVLAFLVGSAVPAVLLGAIMLRVRNRQLPDPTIGELRARVAAAEKVAYLSGINAGRDSSPRSMALTQAWMDWDNEYGHQVTPVTEEEINRLAAVRKKIHQTTLAAGRSTTPPEKP